MREWAAEALPGEVVTALRRAFHFAERLFVRIVLIAGLALVAAGIAALVGPFIPDRFHDLVGAEAVDDILAIIASSMLAVTIFSLSVMTSLHRSVAGQWTPRAHRLIARDRTTVGVLATFVGAWLFALTAIILRSAAIINGGDLVVLFGMTLLVVTMIVVSLVRWVGHLETLGSLEQVGARLEAEARETLEARLAEPFLGGHPLTGDVAIPADAAEIRARESGFVRHVYEDALEEIGRENGTGIYVLVPPGRFVFRGEVIAQARVGSLEVAEAIGRNITVGALRSYDQDPRFGVIVLAEVASKALSPGVNDPGTAIDAIGRLARVLDCWREERSAIVRRPHLWVPPLRAADLVEDFAAPIARDGAGSVEVMIHLRRMLAALARSEDLSMRAAAEAAGRMAMERAEAVLEPADLERLRAAAPGWMPLSAPG